MAHDWVTSAKDLFLASSHPIYGKPRPPPKAATGASAPRARGRSEPLANRRPPRRDRTPPETLLRRRPRSGRGGAPMSKSRRAPSMRSPSSSDLVSALTEALGADAPGAEAFVRQAAADASPDELPE